MNKSQVFKQKLMGLIFLIPGLFFLGVFMIYPVVYSVIMSFTNWTGFNDDYSFIGAKTILPSSPPHRITGRLWASTCTSQWFPR